MKPVKIMKYICLGYFDEKKREAMSENEQNDHGDESFTCDDVLRKNRCFVGEKGLQSARNVIPLRWKNRLAQQKLRAARHAAEFAVWQASGGDFLLSSLANSNSIEL